MFLQSLFKQRHCDIQVVHFYRGIDDDGRVRPFDRAILVSDEPDTSPQRGTLYHLTLYGGRLWRYKRTPGTNLGAEGSFAGSVKVGEVRKGDIKLINHILESVSISQNVDQQHGGQEWTKDGVRLLAKGGFVDLDRLARLYKELDQLEVEYLTSSGS
jgi:hypothetical protein